MSGPHAACGDCEAIRPGLVGQPVNTLTSLAYGVGAVIVARGEGSRRAGWSATLAALAIGSAAYHGPGSSAGKIVHDVSVALPIGMILTGGRRRYEHLGRNALLGTVAVGVWSVSRTGTAWCRPESRLQVHGLWHLLSAAALVAVGLGERRSDAQRH